MDKNGLSLPVTQSLGLGGGQGRKTVHWDVFLGYLTTILVNKLNIDKYIK